MRSTLASLLLLATITPIFGQRALNFRGAGNRVIVISPIVGRGTWADPARPAVLDGPVANGLGGVETANPEGLDARWVPSDDGRWAIVELRAIKRERIDRALESRGSGARVFEPIRQRQSDLETELKFLKRDFRWEDLSGAPIFPVTPGKAATEAQDRPAASGERSAYSYYLSDFFSSINSTNWQLNGSLSGSTTGLKASATAGGSVISKVNPGTNNYEISTTIKLNSGGAIYSHFVRATSNARAGSGTTVGTYYVVDLNVSSFTAGGSCSATLSIQYVNNGSVTTALNPVTAYCRDGMELRSVMSASYGLHVFIDGGWTGGIWTVNIASGQAGVGVRGSTTAGSITQVQLGAIDSTVPTITHRNDVTAVPVSNAVDLRWMGSSDAGRGFYKYDIWRDGSYQTSVLDPVYTDTTVAPNTTYTYTINAWDLHMNAAGVSFNVNTPPAGSIDQRRVGVRPLGSYWGASGENIDLQSGNLNFTIPILKALGRGKTSLPFALSYNSQNWRKDASWDWIQVRNVGFGLGWRLQAGSLTPYYSAWTTVHHYTFTDSTGADYRLDRHDGNGLWTGGDGVYVTYDANTNRLRFNDGSYWQMDCESAGGEYEAGTRYPTSVVDANGNTITLTYQAGMLWPDANSSGRMLEIRDSRAIATARTFEFQYSGGYGYLPVLTKIVPKYDLAEDHSTADEYTFTYASRSVKAPFSPYSDFGDGIYLNGITNATSTRNYAFTYGSNNAVELTEVTLPLGGKIGWTYTDFQYLSGKKFREVASRSLIPTTGDTPLTWTLYNDSADTNRQLHFWRMLTDATGAAAKVWIFETNPAAYYGGLQIIYEERTLPSHQPLFRTSSTWYQHYQSLQPYVQQVITTLDPGLASQKESMRQQTIDQYGNLTEQKVWGYAMGANPDRTYTLSYLNTSTYLNRYLRSLPTSASVTIAGATTVLSTNEYDVYSNPTYCNAGVTTPTNPGLTNWIDPATWTRGNLTKTTPLGATPQCYQYDMGGSVTKTITQDGPQTTVAYAASTDYTLPYTLTPNSSSELEVRRQYNEFFGLTQVTAPNGATSTVGYDTAERPLSTTSPHGAVTEYEYTDSGRVVTATTNKNDPAKKHWTRSTSDGLGRTIKVEHGTGSTAESIVETVYSACACSPVGKVARVSMPYKTGTPVWTVYGYDARGRTISVTPPGGTGSTTYEYVGNTVKVIEPVATRWKKFTLDADGNLTQVEEPGSLFTTYEYTGFGKLKQALMTRNGVTQTRTWNYDPATWRLTSVTLPETGTTSYTYNSQGLIASKTDAKLQRIEYTRDSYNRLTQIQRFNSSGTEETYQRTTFTYDLGTNGDGRLGRVSYGLAAGPNPVLEEFEYTAGGLVTMKMLEWGASEGQRLRARYTYDNEGRRLSITYPSNWTVNYQNSTGTEVPGPTYFTAFDALGRPTGLTDNSAATLVAGAQFNPSGQLTSANFFGQAETRTYNDRGQLILQDGLGVKIEYRFSATQNDGRITHRKDFISGEEVAYQYDALGRLTSATNAATNPWSQTFVHDGFGNLTQRSGSGTPLSIVVNGANNRIVGENYDANGNWLNSPGQTPNVYDVENRLISAPTGGGWENYEYSFRNERIRKGDKYLMYDLDGTLLGEYQRVSFGLNVGFSVEDPAKRRLYFGGRLIKIGSDTIVTDRLGSVVRRASTNYRYYPYGEQINTPTLWDSPAFATYTRDASTGNDYAHNRYYQRTSGRFTTADPYLASGGPESPSGWNRYSYVAGDPVNWLDPSGLAIAAPGCRETLPMPGGSIDTGTNCPPGSIENPGGGGPTLSGPVYLVGPIGGTPGGSAPSAPPPPPNCEVSLKYRPVRLLELPSLANHAYVYYKVVSGTVKGLDRDSGVLEGQPDFAIPTIKWHYAYVPVKIGGTNFGMMQLWPIGAELDWGRLNLSDTEAGKGNDPEHDPTWGKPVSGAWVCDRILDMIRAANAYRSVAYKAWGPNSNGAAKYLLDAGGLTNSFTQPERTPGWYTPIH